MLTVFQLSQEFSCHLLLSLQSLPVQPSCSHQSHFFHLSWDQSRGEGCDPHAGAKPRCWKCPGPLLKRWMVWVGKAAQPPPFNCFLMGSPSKPMSDSLSVFTGSHLVTFLGSLGIPHCGLTRFEALTNCKSICLHDCTICFQYWGVPWKEFLINNKTQLQSAIVYILHTFMSAC